MFGLPIKYWLMLAVFTIFFTWIGFRLPTERVISPFVIYGLGFSLALIITSAFITTGGSLFEENWQKVLYLISVALVATGMAIPNDLVFTTGLLVGTLDAFVGKLCVKNKQHLVSEGK